MASKCSKSISIQDIKELERQRPRDLADEVAAFSASERARVALPVASQELVRARPQRFERVAPEYQIGEPSQPRNDPGCP